MPSAAEKQLEVQTKKFKDIKRYVYERKKNLAQLLPKDIPVEQLMHVAFSCVNKNAALLDCTPESWQVALIDAAQLHLLPSSANQYGHLVPYKNHGVAEVQFQPGFRGLIKLALSSQQIQNIYPRAVHANDEFELLQGTTEERYFVSVDCCCTSPIRKIGSKSILTRILSRSATRR